jgi:hypothetical protein
MVSATSLTSRRSGRLLAGCASAFSLGLAIYTAVSELEPALRLFDGLWMFAGAGVAVAVVAPLIWRWPRERALAVLAAAAAAGTWAPLVVLALRAGIPIRTRLGAAVFWSSADVVGVALPVGIVFAWLALREHRPGSTNVAGPND